MDWKNTEFTIPQSSNMIEKRRMILFGGFPFFKLVEIKNQKKRLQVNPTDIVKNRVVDLLSRSILSYRFKNQNQVSESPE
jgi:hypothetical protein